VFNQSQYLQYCERKTRPKENLLTIITVWYIHCLCISTSYLRPIKQWHISLQILSFNNR